MVTPVEQAHLIVSGLTREVVLLVLCVAKVMPHYMPEEIVSGWSYAILHTYRKTKWLELCRVTCLKKNCVGRVMLCYTPAERYLHIGNFILLWQHCL